MIYEYRYQMTDKAVGDLDEIVSYLSISLRNPQAAANFLDKLQAALQEVCTFPGSGAPVANEFLPYKTVRKKLIGNYIFYYLPDPDAKRITVLRVLYGKRNLDEILREMEQL